MPSNTTIPNLLEFSFRNIPWDSVTFCGTFIILLQKSDYPVSSPFILALCASTKTPIFKCLNGDFLRFKNQDTELLNSGHFQLQSNSSNKLVHPSVCPYFFVVFQYFQYLPIPLVGVGNKGDIWGVYHPGVLLCLSKMKIDPKMKMTLKMRTTPKLRTTPKMKTTDN